MKRPAKKNRLQPWSVHKTGPKAFTHFAGVCSNHSSLRHRRYLGFAAGEMERVAGMVKVRADKYLQWLKSPWKRVYELWVYDFQYVMYIYIYRYIKFDDTVNFASEQNENALRCQVSPRSTSSVLQDLGAFGWAGISLLVVSDRYAERCQPSKIWVTIVGCRVSEEWTCRYQGAVESFLICFFVYHFNEFHPTKHHPHLPSIQWPWVGPPSCLVIWDPWTAKLKFVSKRCDEWNLPEIQQKPEFMVIGFTGCEWFRISWTALNVW